MMEGRGGCRGEMKLSPSLLSQSGSPASVPRNLLQAMMMMTADRGGLVFGWLNDFLGEGIANN